MIIYRYRSSSEPDSFAKMMYLSSWKLDTHFTILFGLLGHFSSIGFIEIYKGKLKGKDHKSR